MTDEQLILRAKLIVKCQSNALAQEAVRVLCKNGLEGLYYFIENFVWISEPRKSPSVIPMSMEGEFIYQKNVLQEIYNAIVNEEDLRIEKSRDMGLSWLMIVVAVWGFLFQDWSSLFGSRKQEEVDKSGDVSKLLPKARFIIKKLPKWMLPDGFDLENHAPFMNIYNPKTGMSIGGESNNANFGTGNRRKFIVFDEFSKWEYTDNMAWISAGAATPCRIALSTPLYKTNHFYVLKKTPIKNLVVTYALNPVKDPSTETGKIWRDKEMQRYSPAEWAQEYEISYEGTKNDSVYFDELDKMRIEKRISDRVQYVPTLDIFIGMDFGMGDLTSIGVYQKLGWNEEIRLIDVYENNNQNLEHYIKWIKNIERPWNQENGQYNNNPDHWKSITVIPDPNQAPNRELGTGKSLEQLLKEAGFSVILRPIGRKEGISESKIWFNRLWIKDTLVSAVEHFSSWHYKWNDRMGEYETEPVHDIHSHFCKQFIYFCAYLKSPEKIEKANRIRQQYEVTEWDSNEDY